MILPDRAYAFFSHTHKAQKENMPLLDKVCCFSVHCCVDSHHLNQEALLSDEIFCFVLDFS